MLLTAGCELQSILRLVTSKSSVGKETAELVYRVVMKPPITGSPPDQTNWPLGVKPHLAPDFIIKYWVIQYFLSTMKRRPLLAQKSKAF